MLNNLYYFWYTEVVGIYSGYDIYLGGPINLDRPDISKPFSLTTLIELKVETTLSIGDRIIFRLNTAPIDIT